ncbi:alcohol dehydrogenase catalytic domain-containing protein [Lentzea guizhouensis]|uniref:alcohol dehydrogenase catalytic domain-containing protein n=1 Tax=Lentzea guizhouensis TaxID=1586287 RepID=UPI000AEC95B3|nr:alcohol dehydrogenase catalytic domain-containing protein [Lentzea guizhouensis]
MRALQFDRFGAPDEIVLREVPQPHPGPGQIRIAVRACGLNPADWAVVDGLLADRLPPLPRGLGFEVAGTVDVLGQGVTGIEIGDRVFGPAAFAGPTAGAAEYAVVAAWARIPDGVSDEQAAALPMAAETAWQALDDLGVVPASCCSSTARVPRWVRPRSASRCTGCPGDRHRRAEAGGRAGGGRAVTGYGDGMADRVTALAGGRVDRPGRGSDRRPDRPRRPGQSARGSAAGPGRADR